MSSSCGLGALDSLNDGPIVGKRPTFELFSRTGGNDVTRHDLNNMGLLTRKSRGHGASAHTDGVVRAPSERLPQMLKSHGPCASLPRGLYRRAPFVCYRMPDPAPRPTLPGGVSAGVGRGKRHPATIDAHSIDAAADLNVRDDGKDV